jgi:hypothetical protein
LYIETGTDPVNDLENEKIINGHPFNGYFLPYPDASYEGLVSTITDVAPILNWIYIDKETYEVKYGVRDFAQPNLTGPFDCTRQDRRMKFEDWEGFVAVEEGPGIWALYFDRDDDALRGKIPPNIRVLEIELTRRESKNGKPDPEEDATTLDEMMKQQKEQGDETPDVAESEGAMGAQTQQEKPRRQPEPAQPVRSAQPPEPSPADSPYYVAPLKVTPSPSPRVSQRGAPLQSQHQPGKQIRPQSQHQPGENVRPERQTKVPVTPEVPKSGKQDQALEIAVQPEQTAQPAEPTPPQTEAPTQPAETTQQETTTTTEPEKASKGVEKTSTGEEKTSTEGETTSHEAGTTSPEAEKASTEPENTATKAEDTPPADKEAEPAKKPTPSVFSRFRGLLG